MDVSEGKREILGEMWVLRHPSVGFRAVTGPIPHTVRYALGRRFPSNTPCRRIYVRYWKSYLREERGVVRLPLVGNAQVNGWRSSSCREPDKPNTYRPCPLLRQVPTETLSHRRGQVALVRSGMRRRARGARSEPLRQCTNRQTLPPDRTRNNPPYLVQPNSQTSPYHTMHSAATLYHLEASLTYRCGR